MSPHWHNVQKRPTQYPGAYDVCEVFSPPRITARARERGDKGGWAVDIAYTDPVTGRSYNLLDPKDESRVREMIKRDRPRLIVASPPCTLFSVLQNLNPPPAPEEMKKAIHLLKSQWIFAGLNRKGADYFCLNTQRLQKRGSCQRPLTWRIPKE